MKTKHRILIPFIAAFAVAPASFAGETAAAAAGGAAIGSGGTAVITVDANGKKETKVINLGDGRTTTTATATVQLGDGKVKTTPLTWMGVATDEVSEEVASQLPLDPGTGLIVEHIVPESPAAKAGLQKNDVLIRLNDQILVAPKQLGALVANRKAGDTIEVTYLRKGEKKTATVTLATSENAGRDDASTDISINLGGSKIDLDRIIKDAANTANSIILNHKTIFVGPDGKPITLDPDAITNQVLKTLKESGLNSDVMDAVKRAFEDVQKRMEENRERWEKPLTR